MAYFKIPGPFGLNPEDQSKGLWNYQAPNVPWSDDQYGKNNLSSHSGTQLAHKKLQKNTISTTTDSWSDEVLVCFNVKGEEFGRLMMELRDEAVNYAQNRKLELLLWNDQSKARTKKWFNSSNQEIRDYLLPIIDSIIRVLRSLTPDNFDYDTAENNMQAGCAPGRGLRLDGSIATVCPSDTEKHRISINMRFFEIPKRGVIYGTNEFNGRDSQLMTLIHEVTHFNDVAASSDDFYSARNSLNHAGDPRAKINADSISSYILGIDIK